MVQYQSFPDAAGASRTLDKLKALMLPEMAGLRFLDVGCNEGFFCGFAAFQGARESVGIDHSQLFIGRARRRFPDCTFHVQGWGVTHGGLPPDTVALDVHGARYAPAAFERYARPDVVRHLGLNVAECGFRARCDIPGIASLADLGVDVQAFAGATAEQATSPLRLAPAIVAMLESSRRAPRAPATT